MIRRLAGLLVPCLALGACVQALGLEEATLDDGTGNRPASSIARSRLSCEQEPGDNCACEDAPQPDCTQCLNSCPNGAVERCTSSNGCREELDAYALCLGSSCRGDQADCLKRLSDLEFRNCVSSCGVECARTKLLSQCELYCACMASYCEGELVHLGDDCLASCQQLDGHVRDCQRIHCELGRGIGDHCMHASGRLRVCVPESEVSADRRSFCIDDRESGWLCDDNSQCCSDSCLSGGTCE
jgi:hypothetical protein